MTASTAVVSRGWRTAMATKTKKVTKASMKDLAAKGQVKGGGIIIDERK
jgi:hypothetical protein